MATACNILGLNEEAFCNHLDDYFAGYPESTLAGKVVQWHLEYLHTMPAMGEDRGRLHTWIIESLWSKDLMIFATMQLPVKYIDKTFYFRFLQALDPDLIKVPIFSAKIVPDSRLGFFRDYLLSGFQGITLRISHSNKIIGELLKRYLRRSWRKNDSERKIIKDAILENYARLDILSAFSDEKNLHASIGDASDVQLHRLLTLILYFKELEGRYGDKVRLRVSALVSE